MYAARWEQNGAVKNPPAEIKAGRQNSRPRGGRKPTRDPEFVSLAAQLWISNQDRGRVSDDSLKKIAAKLDASKFNRPSDCLEKKAAADLSKHNSDFGNSPKKLMSWTAIATRGEPRFKKAMRKLLSRCAADARKQIPGEKLGP